MYDIICIYSTNIETKNINFINVCVKWTQTIIICTLEDIKYANMVRIVLGPKLNKPLPYNIPYISTALCFSGVRKYLCRVIWKWFVEFWVLHLSFCFLCFSKWWIICEYLLQKYWCKLYVM